LNVEKAKSKNILKRKKTSQSVKNSETKKTDENELKNVVKDKDKEKLKKKKVTMKRPESESNKNNIKKKNKSKVKSKPDNKFDDDSKILEAKKFNANQDSLKEQNPKIKKKSIKANKNTENNINPIQFGDENLKEYSLESDKLENAHNMIIKNSESKKPESFNLSASKQKSKGKLPSENKNTSILSFFNQGNNASKSSILNDSKRKEEN